MSTFHIRALDRDHPVAPDLLDLVQAASTGPPYHYDDSEIDPAHRWFPPLVRRSNLALVGVDQGGAPVGYCVTTPLVGSPGLADIERELVSVPVRAHYIAELGVAETVRRRGVGAALVRAVVQTTPPDVDAIVVRTLVENHAAIDLYEARGFRILLGLEQGHRHRRRLFLVRNRSNSAVRQ